MRRNFRKMAEGEPCTLGATSILLYPYLKEEIKRSRP